MVHLFMGFDCGGPINVWWILRRLDHASNRHQYVFGNNWSQRVLLLTRGWKASKWVEPTYAWSTSGTILASCLPSSSCVPATGCTSNTLFYANGATTTW